MSDFKELAGKVEIDEPDFNGSEMEEHRREALVRCFDCGMDVRESRVVTVDGGEVCDVCWFDGPVGDGDFRV